MRSKLWCQWNAFILWIQKRTLLCCLIGALSSFLLLTMFENLLYAAAGVSAAIGIGSLLFRHTRALAWRFFLPFLAGLFYFSAFSHFFHDPSVALRGAKTLVTGYVKSEVRSSENAEYFTMRAKYATLGTKEKELYGDVLVYFPKGQVIEPGMKVACYGKIFKDTGKDDVRYDIRDTKGQYLTMYAGHIIITALPSKWNIDRILYQIRKKIFDRFSETYSRDVSAFVRGLTLGDQSGIEDEIYYAFKESGVSHVLVVSGMHLTFLCGLIWFILSLFHIPLKPRAVLQILLIWGFTAVSGFTPSCCRAAVMLTLFHIGVLIGKENDSLTGLALAVFLCCVPNPYAILDPSLCLSAGATLGILLFMPRIRKLITIPKLKFKRIRKLLNFLWSTFAMSLAATIGCAPVLILMFHTVTVLSPITNVLIALSVEAMFLLSFVSLPLSLVAPLGKVCSLIMEGLYRYCIFAVKMIARIPFSTVYAGNLRFWIILFALTATVILLCVFRKKIKIPAAAGIVLCVIFVIGGVDFAIDSGTQKTVKTFFVDVGQGNTTIIANGHRAVMIDCGGSGLGYRAIDHAMLKAEIRRVETIYFTHLDADHVALLSHVIGKYKVEKIVVPRRLKYPEKAKKILQKALDKGIVIERLYRDRTECLWNRAKLDIMVSHTEIISKDENNNSIVYQLKCENCTMLFPGDLEIGGQEKLLELHPDLSCDILEIPHHGSDGASSEEFLRRVRARHAVISVGEDNQYGLPQNEALCRIHEYIPAVFRTDMDGTVCVYCKKNKYNVIREY